MTLGQLMKFFYDNNIIIRNNDDMERCQYLAFLAAVFFELDGLGVIQNNEIVMDEEMEDYDFDPDTIKILHSINYTYGFDVGIKQDSGFKKLLNGFESCAYPFKDLAPIFEHAKSLIINMTADYYNKEAYYNGTNTFFIDKDIELTDEVLTKLNDIHNLEQCTFFVTSFNGKLVIW